MSGTHKKCASCLWLWRDLCGSSVRRCYNEFSPYFHEERTARQTCLKHECRAPYYLGTYQEPKTKTYADLEGKP